MNGSMRGRREDVVSVMGLAAVGLVALAGPLAAQTEPVLGLHVNTPRLHALVNARIVTRPGAILERATLLIRDDSIEQVGSEVNVPPGATVTDLATKTICPGLIDLYTHVGIGGEAKDPGTQGAGHWNKHVQPQRRAGSMLASDPKAIRDLLACGFTAVVTFPTNGIFQGAGALLLVRDEDPRKTVLNPEVAQGLSLAFHGDGYPQSLMGKIALIRQTWLDAQWYEEAWTRYRQSPTHQDPPETSLALAALQPYATGRKPVILEVQDELDVLHAGQLAREFSLSMWVVGRGTEYRRLTAIRETSLRLIIPLNFPKAPEVGTVEQERAVTLRELRHWDFAPENPARLEQGQIEFVLTGARLELKDFLEKLRLAVRRGLSPDGALAALTTRPAQWLGLSETLGTLEAGKLANFFITDGNLFDPDTRILETWVAGLRHRVVEEPRVPLKGKWALHVQGANDTNACSFTVAGKPSKPEMTFQRDTKKTKAETVSYQESLVQVSVSGDALGRTGVVRMTGVVEPAVISGQGLWGDGTPFLWRAERSEADPEEKAKPPEKPAPAEFQVVCPDGAFGRATPPEQPEVVLVRNATLWTCGPQGILESGDLLIRQGKVAQVGRQLAAPERALVVDASGKHVTPGLIDAHSHIAIRGDCNEGTHAVVAEVRIQDVLNSDDLAIYWQLAGGVTCACTLHGSSNPIGGTYAVLKLRWGGLPRDLWVQDAKPGIKFALGENVKGHRGRYPNTRMGVMESIRDAFQAAKDYRDQWRLYQQRCTTEPNTIPPRRDLRMEHLVEVLEGRRIIHCHAYRQDEVHALLCLAEEVGFRVDVFIHILEGYKVAEELRRHGAMATTFSDWWAYKVEAYDAIPFNGALMHRQGVVVSFNSDDTELGRRLNTEAAKAVKYGGIPPEDALKFVTLNSAKHLFLDHRLGSLEPGKDADLVMWSGPPLSTYSVCEQTWIDGTRYFDLAQDRELRKQVAQQRTCLVQKILAQAEKEAKDKDKAEGKEKDPAAAKDPNGSNPGRQPEERGTW